MGTHKMNKKVLLREFYQLCEGGVCQDILTEQEKRDMASGKKFYMSGCMQKYDTPNGNGRVYSKQILQREVENYWKLVKERRALGECVDAETQIMTKDGWKCIPDISEDEEIYTLNPGTNNLELQKITRKVVLPFDGEMLHFTNGKSIDMMLTPGHDVLHYNRNGAPIKTKASTVERLLKENKGDISHSYLKKGGAVWEGRTEKTHQIGDIIIDSETFAAFMGIYLSEGYVSPKHNKVGVTQKKPEEIVKIENLLNSMPIKFNKHVRANGTVDFVTSNHDLVRYLRPMGKSHEKYVPEDFKNLSPDLLGIFLEWYMVGDGRNRHNHKNELMREIYTTSEQMSNDISEIFFKLGTSASINTRVQRDKVIEGRTILAENSRLLYIISESTATNSYLSPRFTSIERIPYKGDVYCVTVPNGTWMMKRNGKICWTSNCDHPDDSVINLKNASHLVTDMWWDGPSLMGKVEILDTPSGRILKELVKAGVTLGISSRGLGSVREAQGQVIVEDDFQLICFDFVSEPSTPGAFMEMRGGIREHKESNIFTTADKVNRLLNDILRD
jgi:intein/homing endonuclease